MRPAWHLVTSSLSSRRRRTALLSGAIAVATALVVAVASLMSSINRMIESQLGFMFGSGDVQIRHQHPRGSVSQAQYDATKQWPEVALSVGSVEADIALVITRPIWVHDETTQQDVQRPTQLRATAHGNGLDFRAIQPIRSIELVAGRLPSSDDEIVVDEGLVAALSWDANAKRRGIFSVIPGIRRSNPDEKLSDEHLNANRQQRVGIGETVVIQKLRQNIAELTVVGVAAAPPLGGRAQAYATIQSMRTLAGYTKEQADHYTQVDLVLRDDVVPEDVVNTYKAMLGDEIMLRSTAKATSGLTDNMRSSELGLILILVLASMSAAFIIVTGLNTSVAQQQRELAIVRCIGGTRFHLAQTQLLLGVVLSIAGAAVGIPLGIAVVLLLGVVASDVLTTGVVIPWTGPVLGLACAFFAGIGGALWPALRAAQLQPLRSLTPNAQPVSRNAVGITSLIALCFLLVPAIMVTAIHDGQMMFWTYSTTGLPLLFLGYFLLGVPVTYIVATCIGPLLAHVFRLPKHMLVRSIESTPFRHGLTAGALMAGLALMVSIWTSGDSILRDWLGKLQFPDAFVSGIALMPEHQRMIEDLPFVTETCALSLTRVETDVFGIKALQDLKTTFVAFEPEPFFRMTNVKWIQGDEETAIRRLNEGGAVIVAKEFLLAKGLGVGDTFKCTFEDHDDTFEIVGVVASPGLELASRFFNIGADFHEQAMHAVFGSMADARTKFNVEASQLIQVTFTDDVDDDIAVATLRESLFDAGIIDAGSGRRIKETITTFASTTVLAFSVVAVVSMFVACFGVANIVMASIESRKFEFGILRAVGAMQAVLLRLVLCEAVLIAIAASILGTAMGLQASWAATRVHRLLHGLELQVRIPVLAILIGSTILLTLTLVAAMPAISRLGKTPPRELLASGRG
ncbi:MAG: ABC transporter permease [Phycisphaeraceae bacterium]|nr:ABC transporter permease [Phycisphaerales bacterium]MCB9861349.1 ABC transporter permease [Phycisphaeraceae bacterium]